MAIGNNRSHRLFVDSQLDVVQLKPLVCVYLRVRQKPNRNQKIYQRACRWRELIRGLIARINAYFYSYRWRPKDLMRSDEVVICPASSEKRLSEIGGELI